MTAICVMMMAYCSEGDVIVHSGPLYAASEGFVAKILSKFGVKYIDFPAGATREEFDEVLSKAKDMASENGGKVAMIYLESPGNPTNALVDIEMVRDARDAALQPVGRKFAKHCHDQNENGPANQKHGSHFGLQ